MISHIFYCMYFQTFFNTTFDNKLYVSKSNFDELQNISVQKVVPIFGDSQSVSLLPRFSSWKVLTRRRKGKSFRAESWCHVKSPGKNKKANLFALALDFLKLGKISKFQTFSLVFKKKSIWIFFKLCSNLVRSQLHEYFPSNWFAFG